MLYLYIYIYICVGVCICTYAYTVIHTFFHCPKPQVRRQLASIARKTKLADDSSDMWAPKGENRGRIAVEMPRISRKKTILGFERQGPLQQKGFIICENLLASQDQYICMYLNSVCRELLLTFCLRSQSQTSRSGCGNGIWKHAWVMYRHHSVGLALPTLQSSHV